MTGKQSKAFEEGEGDAWFARNEARLLSFDPVQDLACRVLKDVQCAPSRVLEIGAANGFRLAALRDRYGCEVVGTDASSRAVEDGKRRYGIELHCSSAESVELSGTFDLIVIHFLLHWMDRASIPILQERVSELLVPGGLLLLGDFYPDSDIDVPYHHLPSQEVMTYKRDYGALFAHSGDLQLVGLTTGDHQDMQARPGVKSEDRIAIWLMERAVS